MVSKTAEIRGVKLTDGEIEPTTRGHVTTRRMHVVAGRRWHTKDQTRLVVHGHYVTYTAAEK